MSVFLRQLSLFCPVCCSHSALIAAGALNSSLSRCRNSSSSSGSSSGELFAPANHGSFYQSSPQLYNPFIEDAYLRNHLASKLPSEFHDEIFKDLESFGYRISNEITTLGREAEKHPPVLHQYSGWGQRIDHLVTSEAWRKLHDVSAEEGLVAIGYDQKYAQWSRLYQYSKLLLFTPSSGLYSCPLAMTDGAAKIIKTVGLRELEERAYKRLISREPSSFWTSGQWMTEKRGGSDVAGGTTTYAVHKDGHTYRLHGYKWFSSATDADMAFTLARIRDSEGSITEGTKGLSLFYVETSNEAGQLNNIKIERLKNKLGTRQLPTAELLLDGTSAQLIGREGHGVAMIAPMLTITRLHNSISAVGCMRRMVFLARDYATKREAFGRFLADHTLHMRTLAELELETRACTLLVLELAELLGKEEYGTAQENESYLFRLFTPIAKLYTAKKAVSVTSEGLESFGGQGYIEDTGLPTLFRDAQVLPIWEGTTNILSLDVLRALQKTKGEALQALVSKVEGLTLAKDRLQFLGLESETQTISNWTETVAKFAVQNENEILVTAARDLAFSLAHIYIGALLVEKACLKMANIQDLTAVKRWCERGIPLKSHDQYMSSVSDLDLHLVMEGYQLTLKKF